MRLGEALARRSDVQKRLAQLADRLRASAVVQEGSKPPEDPQALLTELDALVAEQRELVVAINLTNAATRLPSGETVTEALAARDALELEQAALRAAVEATTQQQARYSRSEIRVVRQVDVAALRRRIDDLARRRRELDTTIQEHNWTTDLIDTQGAASR
jgi:Family of unknown function (DUF6847)